MNSDEYKFIPSKEISLTSGHREMTKIRSVLKSLLVSIIHRFGYELSPLEDSSPIDLRSVCNHPYALQYHSLGRPILVDLDLSLGRGFRTLPLTASRHPFVYAITRALATENRRQTLFNELKRYYEAVQPTSAADWLNLDQLQNPLLTKTKPWGLSMPWDKKTPEEWRLSREEFVVSENRQLGNSLQIEGGWHFWGPVCPLKLEIETNRLFELSQSIETKGVVRHDFQDGDIRAIILKKADNSWRWQVTGGEHRAAVIAALGQKSTAVRILQIVYREDFELWPGVVSGVFSPEAALATFDLIFEGLVPDIMTHWLASNMK